VLSESPDTRKHAIEWSVRRAHFNDQDRILALLLPFFEKQKLLERTPSEILLLMATGFVAVSPVVENEQQIVGFASVEIYSRKLGEIQCLAVDAGFEGLGIEQSLVKSCVEMARAKGVMEVMAISASDGFLREIGFDYSLPEQKKALFYEPIEVESTDPSEHLESEYAIRRAHFADQDRIVEFLHPFFEQKKLLRRTRSEILLLMATGFVAEWQRVNEPHQIVGFSSVEIYSEKFSEIQCLAVSDHHQGKGLGSRLVKACLELAKLKGVLEVMAISSSDAFLRKLGFEYSLPEQKRALFYQLHSRAAVFNSDE
jgi:amino-acid N-acetyltransferase